LSEGRHAARRLQILARNLISLGSADGSLQLMSNTRTYRLFRPESLLAGELAWQGRPALALGLPAAFTSISAAAVVAAAVALITLGGYTRRVDMEGTVLPNTGVIAISVPSPGRIEARAAQEGDAVKKGAPLYTMDVDIVTKDGGIQQRIIDAQTGERDMLAQEIERKTRINEATEKELQQKIEATKLQINQLAVQIPLQQEFVKKVSNDYNQFVSLVERHLVSLNEASMRQQTWMLAVARLQDLQNTQLRLQGELTAAQYQLDSSVHTRGDEIDTLKSKILEIDEKLANSEAHRLIEIRAPEDGVVTAILAHPGQTVGTGSPMLKIVPQNAPMQAELLAPSSAVGFIHKGGRVLLRYSAFPYQKFGEYWGTVVSVSRAVLNAEEVKNLLAGTPPSQQNGPFYHVVVQPDTQTVNIYGEELTLAAGMQVHAYALLERRQLYEWMLEPLYDISRATRGF
jgi:membrane fusion protein